MPSVFRKVRMKMAGEEGFTLVELMIVIVISVIMLAGMIALVTSAINLFNASKDLQALTDSARRALASMARQVRGALHLDDANCSETVLSFYADIDNDQAGTADVDNYTEAEYIRYYQSGDDVVMTITQPTGDTDPDNPGSNLGSYVRTNGLRFYYFQPGVMPGGADPYNPSGNFTGPNYNEEVGMVRIVMQLSKGKSNRSFYQDVFLRVLSRD